MLKQQQEAEQILKWLKKMMGDAVGSNVCQPDGAGMIHVDVIMSSASVHVFSYRPYSLEIHYRQS
jgi:ethanolamine utilization microcompartment shell protein EutL